MDEWGEFAEDQSLQRFLVQFLVCAGEECDQSLILSFERSSVSSGLVPLLQFVGPSCLPAPTSPISSLDKAFLRLRSM